MMYLKNSSIGYGLFVVTSDPCAFEDKDCGNLICLLPSDESQHLCRHKMLTDLILLFYSLLFSKFNRVKCAESSSVVDYCVVLTGYVMQYLYSTVLTRVDVL